MALFKIATIGNTKDKVYFNLAKQLLEQGFSENDINEIEFVDISGKSEQEILEEGSINGVMYFTDIHNNSNNVEALKTLLNLQNEPNDLNLFAFSHELVTTVEQDKEKEIIKSYLPKQFKNSDVRVAPANITTQREMQSYTKGIVATSIMPYFDYVGSIEEQTNQKISDILKFVNESLEFKHPYTAGHVQRVATFAESIAKEYGCNEQEIQDIVIASALHDIGKIIVPDAVLGSSHALSYAERKQMDIHDKAGSQFLESIAAHDEDLAKKLNPKVLKAIEYHHKDWDGKHDKNSDKIDPINHGLIGKYASIIAVADCIDAMVSQRAYNNPKHILDTFRDLWSNREKQFEPQAAESAILVLGQEIASLGYDPVKMFSEISQNPWRAQIDQGLQSFFIANEKKFEINKNPEPDAYSSLGFRLDENGYFEFNGENSPKRNPEIRLNDEVDFLTHHTDKIFSIPQGAIISKEDIEKAALSQAKQKFEEQDLEGKSALERSNVREIERSIPQEVEQSSKIDSLYNTTAYKEATALTREGLENERLQKEAGIENPVNSFVTVDDNKTTGDR